MTKSRFLLAAALGAAVMCGGVSSAQTIMTPEKGAAPAAAAPAAASTNAAASPASAPAAAASENKQVAVAQAESKPKAQGGRRIPVYLLRGLLNVFSLGMDDLAAKIQRRGIPAVVTNYTDWVSISDDIAAKYKAGWSGPIILIGHSYGADAVMQMGEYLGKKGVPVNLIVPFDGTGSYAASANVQRVFNIYQRDYAKQTRGPGFRGELTNYYVSDPNIGHTTIDKAPKLHNMVLSRIGGGGAPKPAAPAAAPGDTNAAPAVAPAAAPGSAGKTAPHG